MDRFESLVVIQDITETSRINCNITTELVKKALENFNPSTEDGKDLFTERNKDSIKFLGNNPTKPIAKKFKRDYTKRIVEFNKGDFDLTDFRKLWDATYEQSIKECHTKCLCPIAMVQERLCQRHKDFAIMSGEDLECYCCI